MPSIRNPILRGFHPDPSIVRVGEDYYIATSTFEWFPGVQIHHSRDLRHWRLLTYALTQRSQLDMTGNPTSGGVWAPCLSYHNNTFYLCFTDVKSHHGRFKDTHNYLLTAKNIMGPWSDRLPLNSSGFDPSLFHDDDGRKWLLNVVYDFRQREDKRRFGGIVMQEFDEKTQQMVGPVRYIFSGSDLGMTEGPHLYKRDGWYYLLTAEGGTGYNHAVTMARSKTIEGPYEIDPENPVLTSRHNPVLPLQRAGHADLVETPNGEWYMVHLCGRPITSLKRCPLGRETAIQKCVWSEDGWLRIEGGRAEPQLEIPAPDLPEHPFEPAPARDDFNDRCLDLHFNTLRLPVHDSRISLSERPGFLRLYGRESLSSRHRQSLVARRRSAFHCVAESCVEFEPETFQQMAGLICLYDTENYFYLRVTHNENIGKCLGIIGSDNGEYDEPLDQDIDINGWARVYLKAALQNENLQFYFSADGEEWKPVGPVFDSSRLCDEYCREGHFTGTFIGLCCQDLSGRRRSADFDYFEYRESDSE